MDLMPITFGCSSESFSQLHRVIAALSCESQQLALEGDSYSSMR